MSTKDIAKAKDPFLVRKRQLDQGAAGTFSANPEIDEGLSGITGVVSIGHCVFEKSLCKYSQLIRSLSLSLSLFSKLQIANFEPIENTGIKGETFVFSSYVSRIDGTVGELVSLLFLLHAL